MNQFFVRLALLCCVASLVMVGAASSIVASPPAAPSSTIASVRFDGEALTVAVRDDYAYVGLDTGMAILDITRPTQAIVKSMIPGRTITIALSGNYAYTSGGGLLRVIDISQPARLVKVSESEMFGSIEDLAAYGDHVYLVSELGLRVVDASDPLAPVGVGAVPDRGRVYALDVAPDPATNRLYAYVVGDAVQILTDVWIGGGLRVIDVTEPSNPQEVYPCTNETPGCAVSLGMANIDVEGGYAFISHWEGITGEQNRGLNIWDLSDPLHPVHRGNYYTPESSYQVAAAGDRAFFTTWEMALPARGDLLYNIDASDKVNPRSMGVQELDQNQTLGLAVSQAKGCVFAAQRMKGLKILCQATADLTPPSLTYLPMLTKRAG